MKLYTEEQVKEMLSMTDLLMDGDLIPHNDIIASFTPIELPSDEEIDDVAFYSAINGTRTVFIAGAKWMCNKIQGGNK